MVGVNKHHMVFRVEQGLIVVLSVNISKPSADFIQTGESDDFSVKAAEILSCGGNFAGDNDVFTVQFTGQLHYSFVCARTDGRRVGTASQCQADRLYNYRFTGACLAGNNVQAVLKIDFRVFNYGKVADTDMANHCLSSCEAFC